MASYCCKMCWLPVQATAKFCSKAADWCCTPDRPTCFFLGFSVLLHAIPGTASLLVGLSTIIKSGCYAKDKQKLETFLLLDAALAAAFIYFAIKVQRVFSEPYNGNNDISEACCCHPDVYHRLAKFVWKDFSFFVFMMLWLFGFIWSILGLTWASSASYDFDRPRNIGKTCHHSAISMARAAAIIMLCYLFLAPIVFLLAVCLESFRHKDRLVRAQMHGQPPYPQHPYPQAPGIIVAPVYPPPHPGTQAYHPPSPLSPYPPPPGYAAGGPGVMYPPVPSPHPNASPGLYHAPSPHPPPTAPPAPAAAGGASGLGATVAGVQQAAATAASSAMHAAASAMHSVADKLNPRGSGAASPSASALAVPPLDPSHQAPLPQRVAVGVPVNMYPGSGPPSSGKGAI